MDARPEHIISIRGLVNRFGRQVVHDHLDLDVRRDEILGVVGGSGAGKSVLLRSILGLHGPNEGTINVLGHEIRHHEPGPHKKWGVLFQGGALLSGLTVQENVELPIALHSDLPVETRRELAVLKIFMVGLDLTAASKYPNELSRWSPNCCFWMSRPPGSTPSRRPNSTNSSATCTPIWTSQSS